MAQYNVKATITLDVNFLIETEKGIKNTDMTALTREVIEQVGISNMDKVLQGYRENHMIVKVNDYTRLASPEDDIENDLMEFDIFD